MDTWPLSDESEIFLEAARCSGVVKNGFQIHSKARLLPYALSGRYAEILPPEDLTREKVYRESGNER